jgi:hypothetical protein
MDSKVNKPCPFHTIGCLMIGLFLNNGRFFAMFSLAIQWIFWLFGHQQVFGDKYVLTLMFYEVHNVY